MVDKLDRYQDVCLRCGAYNDFPCKEADIFTLDHEGRPKTQERDFSNYGRKVGQ
jgi:hypothetical protein